MNYQDRLTPRKVEQIVKENTDPIELLIEPSDLTHQDIESWENVDIYKLKDELYYDIHEVANSFHERLIQDLALELFIEDMIQINPEHLVFEEKEDMVREGYWPFQTSYSEVGELAYEVKEDIEYYHEYEYKARSHVEAGLVKGYLKNMEDNNE